jgi:hypothetical protein
MDSEKPIGAASLSRQAPPVHHLHQIELANRWRISPRTLERWRWLKQGPIYLKVGGRVVYRAADVEAFESRHAHDGLS